MPEARWNSREQVHVGGDGTPAVVPHKPFLNGRPAPKIRWLLELRSDYPVCITQTSMRAKLFHALLCCTLMSALSVFAADQLVISELSASDGPLEDEDGDPTDWIEIHNRGANTVNLNGWYLTDSAGNRTKWRFPATNIGPNSYMLVYASNKDRKIAGRPLHTNFRLDAGGEYLALVQPDGSTIAYQYSPRFPVQVTGVSYGIPLQQTVTTLIATGAAARVFVPTNDGLGQTWTALAFDDSSWLGATTGVGYETDGDAPTNSVVADSVADWTLSGTQGENNWYYGYYNRTADAGGVYATNDFTPFPRGAGPFSSVNFWTGTMWDWFNGNPPWDEIGQQNMHPNGTNNPAAGAGGEHWVIRRWVSEVGGSITVNWTVRKTNPAGGGVTGRLFHNGVQQDAATIGGTDTVGANRNVTITNVHIGDFIDLALDPTGASDGGDGSDGSAMTMVVRGKPSLQDCIATDVRTLMQDVNAGAYIRIPFVVSNAASVRVLTLRMKYDDGFVANINGVFVADRYPPLFPDTLTWNSTASTNRYDGDVTPGEEIDLSEYVSLLQDGTNVLAIHGLNAAADDADFLILPELRAGIAGAETPPAYLTTPTPGEANGPGSTNLGPIIKQVTHVPSMPKDNEDLWVTAQVTPTINPLNSVQMVYRIMFGTNVTVTMFDDGAHSDGLPGDGVFGAAVPASESSMGQMIRYYIYATDIRTNATRYPVFDPVVNAANAPEYLGTIVDTPQTNGLPILHIFIPESVLALANNQSANTPRYACALFYLGEFYDNCAINRHGQSSAGFPKKSYDLDFNPGHNFKWKEGEDRVDDINLLTTYPDKSQMRNILGYEVFKDAGAPYHFVEAVRVHTNGGFYGTWHMMENGDDNYLKRIGRDPNGALYKMYNTFLDPSDYTISSSEAEKKTRKTDPTGNADLVALFNGVNNASQSVRTNYMYDNIDIAEVLNQLAARTVTSDWDCCHKNYYFYRDSDGTGEWQAMPWDIDLSFGRNWSSSQSYWDDAVYPQNRIWGNWDNNGFFRLLLNTANNPGVDATRQMYLRRVRTLMDEIQQPNDTPTNELRFENQMAELMEKIAPDAAMDLLKWGTWGGGATGIFATNNQYYRTLPQEIDRIRTNYMPARRTFVFTNFMSLSGTDRINFTNAQPTNVTILVGAIDYNPSSANQAEEYIQLINTNRIAVDISGWKLAGAVEHTFQGGVVIPSSNSVYVVPNKKAFRNRSVAPKGGMGLYVEGAYKGQLSARGETILLTDKAGRLVISNSYVGNPSLPQQYLRITEMMYHPPTAGAGSYEEDFEYLELKNIGPVAINLTGVHFTNGIEYIFTSAGVTNLGAGETLILARNPTALATRYPTATNIVGPYVGALDNGGENIQLYDAVGEKILDFSYDNNWYPMTDGNGFSLVIVDENAPFYTWDRKESWRPSGVMNGSPGTNDAPQPAFPIVLVNEVLTHTDLPDVDRIEIFNATTNDVDITDWWLSDDFNTPRKYRIPSRTILAGSFTTFTEADFNVNPNDPNSFSFSSAGDEAYIFSGNSAGELTGYFHGFDFAGAENGVAFGVYTNSQTNVSFVAMSSNTFGFPNAAPKVGPIVISEIMYHPPDVNGADNSLDEFIELHNITTNDVPLFDENYPTNRWQLRDAVEYAFSTNDVVPAGGYLVVVNFATTNATLLAEFRAKYGVPGNVAVVGPYSGKLDNSEDEIELWRPDTPDTNGVPYILVERVHYRDLPPWDPIADGIGAALRRLALTQYGNDPMNWSAAAPSPGAAPVGDTPPVITQQPADTTVFAAGSVGSSSSYMFGTTNFSATVSGEGLFYQWRFNGAPISGANGPVLVLTNIGFSDAGEYSFIVFNGAGSATSSNATLTVLSPVTITRQPTNQFVAPGTNVSIVVQAAGNGTLRYQWRLYGTNIADATNATYSFSNANLEEHHQGVFSVVVEDDFSSIVSSNATIYVMIRPVFVVNPQPTSVLYGGTARFTAYATGAPPIYYRWLRQGSPLVTNTSGVLVLSNVTVSATIRVLATNIASGAAGVNMTPAGGVQMTVLPDTDRDGMWDGWETNYFGGTNASPTADPDGDGMINRDEYVAGTNPTNELSVLKLFQSGGGSGLEFVAQTNIGYTVQFSTLLGGTNWNSVTTVPPQASGVRTILVDAPNPPPDTNRYYRVVTPAVQP